MKKIKITPPEGYEVDQCRSTYEEIYFKPIAKKDLTWEEIQENHPRKTQYVVVCGEIGTSVPGSCNTGKDHVPTRRDAERLMALCQTLVIAEWYNEGWKPDWGNKYQEKAKLVWDCYENKVVAFGLSSAHIFEPWFKDHATALRAYNANKEIFDTLLKP